MSARRCRRRDRAKARKRDVNYCQLRLSHEAVLTSLQPLGITTLLLEAALDTVPKSIPLKASDPSRDLVMELGTLAVHPGEGARHATDLLCGRRSGSLRNFLEFVQIIQNFDLFLRVPPVVEPQNVPPNVRFDTMMRAQLFKSDRTAFACSRGRIQVMACFEMLCDFRWRSDYEVAADRKLYTIVNINSLPPRSAFS